jgi:hypothetical protein
VAVEGEGTTVQGNDPSGLSDEDRLSIPDSWRRIVHPRRGGGIPGPTISLDKKAPDATDALVAAAQAEWLDGALERTANDQRVVD